MNASGAYASRIFRGEHQVVVFHVAAVAPSMPRRLRDRPDAPRTSMPQKKVAFAVSDLMTTVFARPVLFVICTVCAPLGVTVTSVPPSIEYDHVAAALLLSETMLTTVPGCSLTNVAFLFAELHA